MQPPNKAENIYPRTKENIRCIFQHFFPEEKHSVIDSHVNFVYEHRGLELNQIEYVARLVSENREEIKAIIAPKGFGLASAYILTSAAIYDFPVMAKGNHKNIHELKDHFNLN